MTTEFHKRRRQQFLTEAYGSSILNALQRWNIELRANLAQEDLGAENLSLEAAQLCDNCYAILSLRYTAGEPIEAVGVELVAVVEAYERYQRALSVFEQIPDVSPLGLDHLGDYERCMQLLGLCILLHRPDLLARVAASVDPGYKGEDTLYEDLLARYLPDRVDLDEWYHDEPYSPLVEAMYEEEKSEATRKLADYCRRWYPAFKHIPWHDSHLRINGTDGDYFGYWAFEAGAVAYLLELDDSTIDHMVYPKDLVKFAREFKPAAGSLEGEEITRLRCEAGQACPRAGYWFTPAQAGSRCFFRAGEVMPEVKSDYGVTIWQWDADQSPPKL